MAAGTPGIINWQISPVGTATVKPASDPVMLPVAVSDSWPTIAVSSGYQIKNYSLNGKDYTEAELKALTLSESNSTNYEVSTGEYLFTIIVNVVSTSEKKYVSDEGLKYFYDKLKEKTEAALSSTTKEVTLSASSWSSSSYTISDALITATSNQEILPAVGITLDQLKALQKAMLVDGGQSAGSITLTALGTVPTIDIPIRVIFRGTI